MLVSVSDGLFATTGRISIIESATVYVYLRDRVESRSGGDDTAAD
jgi:hypothetical protein